MEKKMNWIMDRWRNTRNNASELVKKKRPGNIKRWQRKVLAAGKSYRGKLNYEHQALALMRK